MCMRMIVMLFISLYKCSTIESELSHSLSSLVTWLAIFYL
jgi:hypothetical protein